MTIDVTFNWLVTALKNMKNSLLINIDEILKTILLDSVNMLVRCSENAINALEERIE